MLAPGYDYLDGNIDDRKGVPPTRAVCSPPNGNYPMARSRVEAARSPCETTPIDLPVLRTVEPSVYI